MASVPTTVTTNGSTTKKLKRRDATAADPKAELAFARTEIDRLRDYIMTTINDTEKLTVLCDALREQLMAMPTDANIRARIDITRICTFLDKITRGAMMAVTPTFLDGRTNSPVIAAGGTGSPAGRRSTNALAAERGGVANIDSGSPLVTNATPEAPPRLKRRSSADTSWRATKATKDTKVAKFAKVAKVAPDWQLSPAGWALRLKGPIECNRTCTPARLIGQSPWKRAGFNTSCYCYYAYMNYTVADPDDARTWPCAHCKGVDNLIGLLCECGQAVICLTCNVDRGIDRPVVTVGDEVCAECLSA